MTKQRQPQEYLYNSEYVTIFKEVDDTWVIVENDHQELIVAHKESLIEKEKSYQYARAKERETEIKKITANAEKRLEELKDELVDQALKQLSARMKLNAMFSNGGNLTVAAMITEQLEKMIKNNVDKVLEDNKEVF